MKAVLIDILKSVAFQLGLISSYSEDIPTDTKTMLIELINDVKSDVAESVYLPALISDELPPINTAGTYTTGTIAIAKGAVTATLTTGTLVAGMVGRKITIGSDYSIYTIKSVSVGAGTFVIDRAFYGTTETVATYTMFQDIYEVQSFIRKIIALTDTSNGDRQIVQLPADTILRIYPDPTRYYGDATVFCDLGQDQNTEAVTVSSATTTTVTATGLTGTYNDYYKDWMLKNSTLNKVVRVSAFVYSTGVLTLEDAISGQSASDSMTLIQPYRKVLIRNTPSDSLSLRVVGYKQFTSLVNDTDIENEIPESYAQSALSSGLIYFYKVKREKDSGSNIVALKQQYEDIKEQIKLEVTKMPSRTYKWGQLISVTELNRRKGGGWGVDYS